MSEICLCGWGAVSPAGWGVPALRTALERGQPLAASPVARAGWRRPLRVREVPRAAKRPAFFTHPRLRRASAISLYAVGAALEALGGNVAHEPGCMGSTCDFKTVDASPVQRLGLVMCLLAGCVQYSQRFFDETLRDPATASPLLFPETVFNAPASHLAVLLGKAPLTYTLLGDPATFLQGLALAADWLQEDRVDACLVVGAEETNWLLADVLWHLDHGAELGGGAGAICLTRVSSGTGKIILDRITAPYVYSPRLSRSQAASALRRDLPTGTPNELLCDSAQGRQHPDAPERKAWQDWPGARLSPKVVLGEGLMAASAWQCVAACDWVARSLADAAQISVVGPNQQAIGARILHRRERGMRASPIA